jgi:pyruvate,orthophosphate dikinase
MQARAIFEAATQAVSEGISVIPEVMVPLVGTKTEFDLMKAVVDETAASVEAVTGTRIQYAIGTMIELPRAALRAGEIAESAEFFSFGTNDLTQTTLGMSRDDCAPVLEVYMAKGIYPRDPFATLDREGVGELIKIASERGRKTKSDIKLGICGEHGGDPDSIAFCREIGLDYVSCSPYRVPVARLAAAQAELSQNM